MFRQESGVAVVLEERVFRIPSCNGAPRSKPVHGRVFVATLRVRQKFLMLQHNIQSSLVSHIAGTNVQNKAAKHQYTLICRSRN